MVTIKKENILILFIIFLFVLVLTEIFIIQSLIVEKDLIINEINFLKSEISELKLEKSFTEVVDVENKNVTLKKFVLVLGVLGVVTISYGFIISGTMDYIRLVISII